MASKLSNVLHKEYNTILESTEFYDTEILIAIYIAVILTFPKNNIKTTNVKLLIAADELCLGDLCNFIEKYFLENKRLLEQNLVLIQDITTKFSQFKELSRFYKKAIRRDPSLIFKANRLMEWCIAQSSELLLSDASNWTPSEIEIIEEEEDDDDDSEMTDQY
ncbi:hypothetical protein GLOIN_2v1775027 [Rhizophagus irregularis DAOM 181602=DAOM 197198]|uniref:Uncharacterized protein n=1 Tax=Rhizophagus irregularis (strain DAOM 181602 / DAOM 197198 / MUCL 43194) TaxID=747089 RepID=A0A2P4Q0T2_RHIID|nr:hypothetical protein GLOIN_2v1775027 [Rhizophagus irregularis DAOM 181602=DAOM 197198]POG71267.1 hypothetical protein GLOIN_2v1775027 [Rhizophagus irregularis DAOM 181602=DAOM 197198]|eukprot:XP_025178133.1 hypothetical protein GLOIN_2v1775027 [Rhizophagus irregularis DAOM 181602=DAOM 197198]